MEHGATEDFHADRKFSKRKINRPTETASMTGKRVKAAFPVSRDSFGENGDPEDEGIASGAHVTKEEVENVFAVSDDSDLEFSDRDSEDSDESSVVDLETGGGPLLYPSSNFASKSSFLSWHENQPSLENSSLVDAEQDDFLTRYTLSEESSETETMRKSLEINMALQKLVMGELNVLHLYLVKCRRRQEELESSLDLYIRGPGREGTASTQHLASVRLTSYHWPYFQSRKGDVPPPAEGDLEESVFRAELKPRPWKKFEQDMLLNAVAQNVIDRTKALLEMRLQLLETRMSAITDNPQFIISESDPEASQETNGGDSRLEELERMNMEISEIESSLDSLNEDQDITKIVGPRNKEHDWLKISTIDFQGSRSSEDCQLMWKNLLHPSINKKTWTEREEDVLVQLAASGEDWDTIAESLRTNRTGFQCCVRFQRLNKAKSQAPWTPEESQKLLEVVEMCRFTSRKIPWSTVAAYMEGRTPEQLCRKYKDQIRQECAKGKFSHSEDIVLMACVEKFRTNFSHMTSFFRSRSVTQLQERYRHLRCRVGKRAAWTRKEDDLLLDLVNNSGVDPNWDIIADELTGRDAVQCRGRFSTIYNHLKRMPVLPPGNEQLAPTQNLIGGYTFDELRKEAREHVEKAEAIVQENASLNGFVVTAKDVIEQVIKSLPNIKPRTKIPKRPTVPARRGKVDEDLDSFFATSARRSIGRPRYLTNEALTERFKVFRRLLISLGLTKFIKPNSLVEILEHSPMEVLEGVNFDIISNSEQQSIPMSQFAEWWVKESGEEPAVINSEGTWFPLPMTLSSLLAFRAILLHRRRLIKYIQESKLRAANESRRKSRPDASQIPDVPVMTQGHALKLVIEKMDAGPGLPPVVKVIPPKGVSQDLITKALSNKHLMSKILAQKGSSRTVIVLHPGILQGAPTMNPASQRLDGDAAKNLFLQQFLSLFAWPAYLCRQNPMLEIFEVEKRRKPGHITRGDLLEGLGPLIERMDQAQQGSRSHKIHVLSTAVPKFKRAMLESDAQGQSEDRDCPPKKRIRISTPATRVRESRRLKAKNQVKMLPEGSRSPLLDSEEVEPQISDMNLDPFS